MSVVEIDHVGNIDRKIGDREISTALYNFGMKPSEIRMSRIDQTGRYIIVETCRQEAERDDLCNLVKCSRFHQLSTTFSVDGSFWIFFKKI